MEYFAHQSVFHFYPSFILCPNNSSLDLMSFCLICFYFEDILQSQPAFVKLDATRTEERLRKGTDTEGWYGGRMQTAVSLSEFLALLTRPSTPVLLHGWKYPPDNQLIPWGIQNETKRTDTAPATRHSNLTGIQLPFFTTTSPT